MHKQGKCEEYGGHDSNCHPDAEHHKQSKQDVPDQWQDHRVAVISVEDEGRVADSQDDKEQL